MKWMKRVGSLVLAGCIAASALPALALDTDAGAVVGEETVLQEEQANKSASQQVSGYWKYEVVDNRSVKIVGYTGSSTDVVIPDTLDGSTVTEIGSSAFENSNMTSLTIPESITSIGYHAFYNCIYLSQINFNAKNCDDCGSYFSDIFYNAGSKASSLSVTFGSGVTRIPAYLFKVHEDYNYGDGEYAHITSVSMSDSAKEIGTAAFKNCYDLKDVTWSNAIEKISSEAFAECRALTSVTIPATTTTINNNAFYNCAGLKTINYNAKNCDDCGSYFSEVFYNAGGDTKSVTLTVGSGVVRIPANLFKVLEDYNYGDGEYAHLTSATIPASVQEIGSNAFKNCYDLKTITYGGTSSQWAELMAKNEGGQISSDAAVNCTGSGTSAASTDSSNPFYDVSSGDWYLDPVLWAVNKGITNGTSDTTFSPNNDCTRGQIVTFLWRAANSPEPSSANNPFTDVSADAYYYKAVLWAVEKGITTGTSDTTFSPDATCKRSEAVTFIWRANGKPAAGSSNPFTDVANGEWFTDAVLWAVGNNITNGMTATTFEPNRVCSRGQIVTFLYRAA